VIEERVFVMTFDFEITKKTKNFWKIYFVVITINVFHLYKYIYVLRSVLVLCYVTGEIRLRRIPTASNVCKQNIIYLCIYTYENILIRQYGG